MAATVRGATRARTFPGGYVFRHLKGDIGPGLGVVDAPLPERAIVPLAQGFGAEVPALVKQGDRVAGGQIIGRDDETISTPVHAPVSGRIERFIKIETPDGEVTAVEIKSDGSQSWNPVAREYSDALNASPGQLAETLYLAGVTALGKAGIPTPRRSSAVAPEAVDTVVVSAVRSEPYTLPNDAVLGPKVKEFAVGVRILQRVFGRVPAIVALDARDGDLVRTLCEELPDDVDVRLVTPKYPAEHDEVVAELVTYRTVPDGKTGLDVGVLVVDVQTCLAVHAACVEGKPLIERLIALGGTGYASTGSAQAGAGIVRARVGTPARWLVKDRVAGEHALIHNGVLSGWFVSDLDQPVTRATWGLTALHDDTSRPFMGWMAPGFDFDSNTRAFASSYFPPKARRADTNMAGELRPCIQCGYCSEVCPRDLLPFHLDRLLRVDAIDEAEELRLFGCIDCGLCSYVCVSKIPLMTHIIAGRKRVLEEHQEEAAELRRRQAEEEACQEAGEARKAAEASEGSGRTSEGGAG